MPEESYPELARAQELGTNRWFLLINLDFRGEFGYAEQDEKSARRKAAFINAFVRDQIKDAVTLALFESQRKPKHPTEEAE